MKRLTTIGLCLIGTLATSAAVTASASAEAPEYGRCVKGVAHEGGFSGPTCVATDKMDNDGVYEWLPGAGSKAGFSTKGNTSVTFETVKGTKVICGSEHSTGEVVGVKELRIPSIKLNGCKSAGGIASTKGAAREEIVTPELTGHLRFAAGGKARRLVDMELVPTSPPLFVEFEVSGFKFELQPETTGGLLTKIVGDKMLTLSSDQYAISKGEQKPSEYEDLEGKLVQAGLEQSFAGYPFEEVGLNFTAEQTNEEAIEVNAVV